MYVCAHLHLGAFVIVWGMEVQTSACKHRKCSSAYLSHTQPCGARIARERDNGGKMFVPIERQRVPTKKSQKSDVDAGRRRDVADKCVSCVDRFLRHLA